ncbi:hypothetical protein WL76_09360 [Burkholderia ubonensis]|nr:hypothetical protein WK66_28840 [Burkholderia ubonensis]KVV32683.1 hypothetical protein WK79_00370 [Burkholderia ubonensis]KVX16555.1 hypothetical protein WL02_17085 [Burkholderia ubonensis]KWE58195.1 hypothetical protein WL76_09360 [Burkholderia ubonensis]
MALLGTLMSGCAEMPMNPPQPTIENAARLRGVSGAIRAVTVGRFALDESKPASMDRGVSIRSNMVRSPVNDSLAQYLRETLRVELQSAGLLDVHSDVVITGTLIDSSVEAPVGVGRAVLEACFVVTHSGVVHYERTLRVESTWDSPFIGVSAIPQAAGQYEALYRKLIGMLLEDSTFRAAVAR